MKKIGRQKTKGLDRERGHETGQYEAGRPTAVSLGPGLEWLQRSLQANLGTDFSVVPGLPEDPVGLVVLTGDDPAGVVSFACDHPAAWVVAVTGVYGEQTEPTMAAAVLEGGAQDYQTLQSVPVLAAHLRAISRRPMSPQSRPTGTQGSRAILYGSPAHEPPPLAI